MQKLYDAKELAETIGKFIEYWGFRSIHGRIWTLVFLADRPISTPELVEILGVSKGLVSGAINELIDYSLIEPSHKVFNGAQTYLASENVGEVVRRILEERELRLLAHAEHRTKYLLSMTDKDLARRNISKAKLGQLSGLVVANKSLLARLIQKDYGTMAEWIRFLKKAVRISRF